MQMTSRIIKLIISIFIFCIDYAKKLLLSVFGKSIPAKYIVLYYHLVTPKDLRRFVKQMDILTRLAKPVRANYKGPIESGTYYVVVTFDDGFIHTIETILPELIKRKIPIMIFIPTGFLGQKPGWIKNNKYLANHEIVATDVQLKKLNKEELISIGSHCVSHCRLNLLKENIARQELTESKKTLESILLEKIDYLSFPYGSFNENLVKLAHEAGYKRIFTILPKVYSINTKGLNEYIVGRFLVEPSDWNLEFKLKILGAYRWLITVIALKKIIRNIIY